MSEERCEKKWIPKHIQNCKMCDPYCKYHMFWEVVHPWIWWFGLSFWVPFGVTFSHCLQKMWFEASKNTHLKNTSKFDGKRSRDSTIHFATEDHGKWRKTTEDHGKWRTPPPSNPYPGRATPAHPRAEALILLSLRIIRAKALVHYVYSSFPLSSHAGSADI